jgi:tetratricopeptide (TPR) repeat protein
MKSRIAILTIFALLLSGGLADAEQVRLRTGDLLQGEVVGEQSTENHLAFRLYRTGGIFKLRWDQLIREDKDRLQELLGYAEIGEEEVPREPGHEILLRNGERVRGLVLNPEDMSGDVRVRTATGERAYPRDMVAKIEPAEVEAPEIYSTEELYQRYLQRLDPETYSAHIELADLCMRIGAYEQAKQHYELSLEDEEIPDEKAQMVKNRLMRVEVFLEAKEATDRVGAIKRLRWQKRFDEALEGLSQLESDYQDNEKILDLLQIERLTRQITADRRKHFMTEVRRRFYRVLNALVRDKVREKELGMKDALLWAQNQKGLTQDIFSELSAQTGLGDPEARELWEARTKGQVKRYNYGSATFMHHEVAAKTRKLVQAARAGNRQRQGGRNNPRGGGQQQQQKPKTAAEWWEAHGLREKENLVKAWFAEFAGVLEVARIENQSCSNCGGKGVTITNDASTGEQVRFICTVCNLAGHERIVICR